MIGTSSSSEKSMLITMMSTSLRLQGEMRGLVMGLRQLTMNSATTHGNLAVHLAGPSNRQFSAAAPLLEIPKKPNTPWVNFFKANLPEHRKKNPGAKVSVLMSKIGEEWRKLPAQKKEPMVAQYEAEKVKYLKLMDKVPEEVKEQAKAEKRQKKVIASSKNAAMELKDMLESLGKPKRPLTGYMLFSKDRRARMTASERQKSPTEQISMLAAEWKGLSEAQKLPYLDKYEKLKAEHDRVMEKWTEKMSREGKMTGILAAQARVADLKEYRGVGS